MAPPTIIPIELTNEERLLIFKQRTLKGGAGIAIMNARARINSATGRVEMLPQHLVKCREARDQFKDHTGTYQNILAALIAAGERGAK